MLKPYTKVEGICAAASPSAGEGALCWMIHEDGSMQCHQCGVSKPSDDSLQIALKVSTRAPLRCPDTLLAFN